MLCLYKKRNSILKTTLYGTLLFFFFFGRGIFAQKIDSLQQLVKVATEDTNKVKTLNILAKSLINNGSYDASLKYAIQAINLSVNLSFKKGEADSYSNIGRIYYSKGNYAAAITNQFEYLKCAEQLKSNTLIANAYDEIANIYDAQASYDDAIKYYLKSLELRKLLDDKEGLAKSYNNIGTTYDTQGKYTEALDYYNKSLKINLEIKNNEVAAFNYANIGYVYKGLNDYAKALQYTQKSIDIDEQYGYTESASAGYFNLGEIYYLQKKYKLASTYFNRSLKIAKDLGLKDYIKEGYLGMANLDSALGDYKSVYHNYRNYIIYRDSLNNEESTKKILQEQFKYESERKETIAKAEQDKKDAIAATERKRQLLVLWLIGIAGAGVSIVALVIYRSLQQNKKAKKIIETQKHEVELHQKEILDSITYAKRLQQAILPAIEEIKKYLPNSFLFYKPKDIVAGDFYWMEYLDRCVYIAAADSTGHGVPGAMVSIVCSNGLNRAVKEFELRDTGKILDKTRELVLETFEKSGEEIKDGMDISLCKINLTTNQVQWSGANNALWYIKNKGIEVLEIKADKQPIGKTDHAKPFTSHNLDLQKGDTLYLMTDGYPDQFGGPKGKKYKHKQLQAMLLANSSKSLEEQKDVLFKSFHDWKGILEQVDDVTVIGIGL